MAAVERFEDLRCWQEARKLTRLVYLACENGKLLKDFETKGQFRGAALSTMSNIAEGFGRRFSDKEFIKFLDYSQGSSMEVKSISYVLEDMDYLPRPDILSIRNLTDATTAKTLSLIRYLRSHEK